MSSSYRVSSTTKGHQMSEHEGMCLKKMMTNSCETNQNAASFSDGDTASYSIEMLSKHFCG